MSSLPKFLTHLSFVHVDENRLTVGTSGDFIEAFLDALRDESPGSSSFDEDTIGSVLSKLLNGG
jgi:hypothetical protein